MDFELTEDQRLIRNTIRDFIQKECPDKLVREMDEKHEVPSELLNKLADIGVCGLTIPQEYGGTGPNLIAALIIEEELARQWPALAWFYVFSAFYGATHILDSGNDSQKEYFLPKMAKGKLTFSYALTEPGGGSDLSMCTLMAVPQGDEFVLDGQKAFISGADYTDYALVFARTSKDLPRRQAFTMFIVDSNFPGIEVHPLDKIGMRGSSTCEMFFDDVHVPKENILGGPDKLGNGWEQLFKTLVIERLEVAAGSVGLAQGAFDKAFSYAKERIAFGQSIIKFQAIGHKFAEMATEIQAARLLLYFAAHLAEQGKDCSTETAMAKLFAADVAQRCSYNSMLIGGGHGYMAESEMQRYYRDAPAFVIGGGTPEILKDTIIRGIQRGTTA